VVKSIVVQQGIIGGEGKFSGNALSFGAIDRISVGGDVRGGSGLASGGISRWTALLR
jgi:hypothetical protein